MTTPITPVQARKPALPKWLKRMLWLSLIPIVLVGGYYLFWIYDFVYGGTFSPIKLVDSIPCDTGEYQLLVYVNDNSDGYFELVDRSGKVLATSKFSEGAGTPVHWHDDCLAVNVGSDDGVVILEVPQPGPSRFDTPLPNSSPER